MMNKNKFNNISHPPQYQIFNIFRKILSYFWDNNQDPIKKRKNHKRIFPAINKIFMKRKNRKRNRKFWIILLWFRKGHQETKELGQKKRDINIWGMMLIIIEGLSKKRKSWEIMKCVQWIEMMSMSGMYLLKLFFWTIRNEILIYYFFFWLIIKYFTYIDR